MDGATATIIAASIGAGVALLIAFIGVNVRIFTRLGGLEQGFELLRDDYKELREDNRQLREEMREEIRESNRQLRELIRSESEQTRAEIRRLTDAMLSHYHDEDGNTRFRVPPP